MSRFFTAGDSSSESSSSDEEELYSDEEPTKDQDEESSSEEEESESEGDSSSSDDDAAGGFSRFLRDAASDEDSSSDSDTPKVVKSAKSKRFAELEGTIRLIDNAIKINDWSSISTEFDKLNRQVVKLDTSDNKPPKSYIKSIADLEDFMNETIAKQKVTPKKMNATNAKGLNAMKQKVKKTNKEHETEINKYREDKGDYMMSDEEEEAAPKPSKRSTKTAASAREADGGDDDQGFLTVGRGGRTLQYTPESILSHLRIIHESRGKKNTDRQEQIKTMERLLAVAATPYQKIRVYLSLISTRFDLTTGSLNYMQPEQWKQADVEFGQLLEILEENRDHVVLESAEAWDDDDKPPQPAPGAALKIPGSVVSFVERLDDELTRSLQHIDPHAAEYIERLTDEQTLYNKIVRAQLYAETIGSDASLEVPQETVNRVVIRRIEHIYFKPSQVITIQEDKAWESIPAKLDSKITPAARNWVLRS